MLQEQQPQPNKKFKLPRKMAEKLLEKRKAREEEEEEEEAKVWQEKPLRKQNAQ